MSVIGKLKVILGLDSSDLERNAKRAKQAIDGVNESVQQTGETVNQLPSSKPIIDPKQTQQSTRNLGQLNLQIQQVARELPSLAMGPQMFFLAISNNLPMLTDEIAKARKEYEALVASGQKGTPVWKQLLQGIVSWQTALVVGITVLVAYGKDISNFFSELFTGKKAFDAAAAAAQNFHNALAQGAINAVEETTKLDLLYKKATDTTSSIDERRRAVEKLQELYPAYFANMTTEQVLAGQAVKQYNNLRNSIIEVAKARAALNLATSVQEDMNVFENAGLDIKKLTAEYKEYQNNVRELTKLRYNRDYRNRVIENVGGADAFSFFMKRNEERQHQLYEQFRDFDTYIQEELEKSYNGKALWEKIEKEYNGSAINFMNTLIETNEEVSKKAGESLVMETPQELNEAYQKWLETHKKYKQEQEEIDKSTLAYEEAANKKEIEFLQSQQEEYGNTMVYLQRMISLLETKAQFAKSDEELTQIREETEAYKEKYAAMQQASGVTPAKGSEADLKNQIQELKTFIANANPYENWFQIQEAEKKIKELEEKIARLPQNYKMTLDVDVDANIDEISTEAEKQAQEAADAIKAQQDIIKAQAEEIAMVINEGLNNSVEGLFASLGEMAVGEGLRESLFQNVLLPLADSAVQIGKMLIGFSVVSEALNKLLAEPWLAAAAGAALIALGSAAKAAVQNQLDKTTGGGSGSSGYNTYTGGFSGGYSNNGAYTSRVPDLVQAAGTNVTVDVSGSLKGEDIALAVKKVTYNKSR